MFFPTRLYVGTLKMISMYGHTCKSSAHSSLLNIDFCSLYKDQTPREQKIFIDLLMIILSDLLDQKYKFFIHSNHTFSEICIALMSLLGMFIGMDFVFGKNLKVLLGFAVGPSTLALLVLIPMHETPKFLYIVKRRVKAASKSVKFYQGQNVNVDSVLHEIALEAEHDSESNSSLKEIMTTPYLRKSVVVSCAALQVTVSLWSILLSSTRFLKDSGVEPETAGWASTAMAFTYFLGTSIGAFFVDKFGRRPMILTFLALNTLSLLLFVIFSVLQPQVHWFKYGCLGCFLFYGLFYG